MVPDKAEAGFDIRVPPGELDTMRDKIKEWTNKVFLYKLIILFSIVIDLFAYLFIYLFII